ncbi:hypothetical protein M011DRAFT_481509 [Sporormia fimetaria CBS 119925]|uniref:DUF7707 domain-containing protein n=1 Tax=Sporormia fimetaria CBS 119925 TaxID=1340428 RepID=A0A6A6UYK3_9PLEO|nr:hypothetical protein M011DRAFT_481509 [Sporormia fimetaria CBS 119925]
MHSAVAFTLLAVAGFAAAQDAPQQNYPYTIDPNSVPKSLRRTWCLNQQSACPYICTQLEGVDSTITLANECDPDALTYACVCENGLEPNITQYSQTLPFYICQEWGNNCARACGNDNTCASACREDHPCGAQNPEQVNTTSSASMSATASETSAPSRTLGIDDFGGEAAETSSSGNNNNNQGAASSMLNLGQSYGLAVVVGGILGGLGLFL